MAESFLRQQYQRKVTRKRGLYSQSPSKFLSRKFLKTLRENNYITDSGIEYSPCEVDSLYFEKCNRLTELEAIEHYKNLWGKESC